MDRARTESASAKRNRVHPRTRLLVAVVGVSLAAILVAMVYTARENAERRAQIAEYDATIATTLMAMTGHSAPPASTIDTAPTPVPAVTPAAHATPTPSVKATSWENWPLAEFDLDAEFEKNINALSTGEIRNLDKILVLFLDNPDALNPDIIALLREEAAFRKSTGLHGVFEDLFDPAAQSPDAIAQNLAAYILTAFSSERSPALRGIEESLHNGPCRWKAIENDTLRNTDPDRESIVSWTFYNNSRRIAEVVPPTALLLATRSIAETRAGDFEKAFDDICLTYDFLESLELHLYSRTQSKRLDAGLYADKALWYLLDNTDFTETQTAAIRQRLEHRTSTEGLVELVLFTGSLYERLGPRVTGDTWKVRSRGAASPLNTAQKIVSLLRQGLPVAASRIRELSKQADTLTQQQQPSLMEQFWYTDTVVAARQAMLGKDQTGREPYELWAREQWQPAVCSSYLVGQTIGPLRSLKRTVIMKDVFETALQLKRWRKTHGAYPAVLQTLVPEYIPKTLSDPFTEKPIEYAVSPSGFVITGTYPLSPMDREPSYYVLWRSRLGNGK